MYFSRGFMDKFVIDEKEMKQLEKKSDLKTKQIIIRNGDEITEYHVDEKQQKQGRYTKINNGFVLEEIHYLNDQLHGSCTKNSIRTEKMQDDVYYSHFTYTCTPYEQANYEYGLLHGLQIIYSYKGIICQQAHYFKGLLHGERITYDYDGHIDLKENYVNGLKDGTQIYYHNYDKVCEVSRIETYEKGILSKPVQTFGYAGLYECEMKKITSKGIEENIKHGKEILWLEYTSEKKWKKTECHYQNGNLHGLLTSWFKNGNKHMECTYNDDKPHGLSTYWFEDGHLLCTSEYKYGKFDGKMKKYHEGNLPCFEADYVDNKLVKIHYYQDNNGRDCTLGEGEIEVYKDLYYSGNYYLVTISVPAQSRRVSTILIKDVHYGYNTYDIGLRIEFGYVKSIVSDKGKHLKEYKIPTKYGNLLPKLEPTFYKVGEIIRTPIFNEDINEGSGEGITVMKYPEHAINKRWQSDSCCVIL